MPDLIILGEDQESAFRFRDSAEGQGWRVKLTFEESLLEKWLNLKSFDLMLLSTGFKFESQQRLAFILWEKNPQAGLFLYNLDPRSRSDDLPVRLFGADLLLGENALPKYENALVNLAAVKRFNRDNFKIMVVEDLDSPRDLICSYIEGLGYPLVQGFCSAKQAIAELTRDSLSYSCILTDIRMPEMGGQQLIAYIRERSNLKHLPIIVLTAHGTSDYLLTCLQAGASGFLVKPPRKRDLVRELARAVRISLDHENPRLVEPDNAKRLGEILLEKGIF